MSNLNKALLDIENIRIQLSAGTVFQGFGPSVIALTAGLAGIAMGLQLFWPGYFAIDHIAFIATWIITALISAIFIGVEMIARSRRHHGGLADKMLFNAMEHFLPSAVAATIMTAIIMVYSSETVWMLPGLWQIFLCLGLFAAARSLPASLYFVGAWYFLTGTCMFFIGSLTQTLSPWMMGLPFCFGQLFMAVLLYIASEDQNNEE